MKISIFCLLLFVSLYLCQSTSQKKESFLYYYVQDMSTERKEYVNFVNAVRTIITVTQPQIMTLISVSFPKAQDEKGTSGIVSRLLQLLPLNVKYRLQDYNHLTSLGLLVKIRPRFYNVFFLNDFPEFVADLLPHFRKLVFDHRGFYIVVLTDTAKWPAEDIQNLMDVFWSLYVVNLNILLQDVDGTILSMTYFPYGPGYCEEVRPVVTNKYINGSFIKWRHFPWKLHQFHGCPLIVGVTDGPPFANYVNESFVSGIEGTILHMLDRALNFTPKFISTERYERQGRIFPNGTITGGGLGMLWKRKVNLTIGFYGVRADYLQRFDITTGMYSTKLQFLATLEGDRAVSLEYLWITFKNEVWICIGISLIIGLGVIYVLKLRPRFERDFIIGRGIHTPTLNFFTILFGNPLSRLPGTNFARTLLIYFFFFTLVLRTAFQGSLYEVAQRDPGYVNSFDEMIRRNFSFYSAWILKYYIDSVPQIKDKVIYVVPNENTFNRVTDASLQPGSRETALTSQFVIYHLNQVGKKRKLLRPIKEDVALVSLGICLPKQSLLTRLFNEFIFRFSASGLTTYSMKKYYNRDYLTAFRDHQEPKQTQLKDVAGVFQLLAIGWTISTFVFIGEIIYHKYSSRARRVNFVN